MSTPHNDQELGKILRNKKKRSAVFIVIVISIVVHLLALGGLAAIKIIEVLQAEPEFEAPPIVAVKPPTPPPPPPPTSKRAQRSMPRPQPLAVKNAQNTSVPAIEINNANLTVGGGRGFGGGLGALGGAVADSIRITSFGFDRALVGTLEGTLYDFKRDEGGTIVGNANSNLKRAISDFKRGMDFSRKFYKSEKNLYASYFIMPWRPAELGPKAFGIQDTVKANFIGVYYKGSFKPEKSGRYRFWGCADNFLYLKLNGQMAFALNGPATHNAKKEYYFGSHYANWPMGSSDWFDLREGYETEVEILLGEADGDVSGVFLLVEEHGVSGLKIFSTRALSTQDKEFLRKLHPDVSKFL